MRCDSWASLLAHTFASPYIGRKPKVKVKQVVRDGVFILKFWIVNLSIG